MTKLPKKDLLKRQVQLNNEIQKQRLSNPMQKSNKELTLKPSNSEASGKTSVYKKREFNFKKKPLASKIK